MPILFMNGDQDRYAAAELLRLFFGDPVREESGCILAGSDKTVIDSRLVFEPASPDHPEPAAARVTTDLGAIHLAQSVHAEYAGREFKRQLYQALAQWTGRSYPWGSLTGVRPTLIAGECLARQADSSLAAREMTDHWFVSPAKADLALAAARAEQAVLHRIPDDSLLVYIGIPFCPSRCAYCSFITQDAPAHAALLDPYVDALIKEVQVFFAHVNRPVSALYVGGGTPTSLSAGQLDRLLKGILPRLPWVPDAERTVEAGRPDTIDAERLEVLRAAGTTRLCINPQTFHDATLQRIGRRHTVQQAFEAMHLARTMGFHHINIDLIAGLPGETPEHLDFSLQQALSLDPTSLTLHALALKRHSDLDTERFLHRKDLQRSGDAAEGGLQLQPAWEAMLVSARSRLAAAGLLPYYLYKQKNAIGGLENTGFARPGKACRYNVGMMSDRFPVIGFGSGAISKRVTGSHADRLANPRSITVYLERIDELAGRKPDWFRTGAG